MGKIRSSWTLIKNSWSVLMENKKLLLFPIVNTLFIITVLVFFLSAIVFYPTGHEIGSEEHWKAIANAVFDNYDAESESHGGNWDLEGQPQLSWSVWVAWVPLYLLSMFMITFFNTAFYSEILKALNGEAVSIKCGLKFALTRLKPIAMWSLFAGVVGVILRAISENLGFVGRIVTGFIGIVWSVAAVFAIPVIIREQQATNPLKTLRASALLIKQRWGEGLIGYLGIRGMGVLIILPFTLMLIAVVVVLLSLELNALWVSVTCAVLWFVAVIIVTYIQSIMNSIFQCALYVYAAEGSMPGPFDDTVAASVWRVKKTKLK